MLGVGQKFPEFNVTSVVSVDPKKAFAPFSNKDVAGKWLVIFFWPKDFTFVCPTEIAAFGKLKQDFADRDAVLVGASIDSELSSALGILDPGAGVSQRAVYIVDPEGTIKFVMVTDLSVGRNTQEVLRVLDALQTDELCPCNWNKGEETIHV